MNSEPQLSRVSMFPCRISIRNLDHLSFIFLRSVFRKIQRESNFFANPLFLNSTSLEHIIKLIDQKSENILKDLVFSEKESNFCSSDNFTPNCLKLIKIENKFQKCIEKKLNDQKFDLISSAKLESKKFQFEKQEMSKTNKTGFQNITSIKFPGKNDFQINGWKKYEIVRIDSGFKEKTDFQKISQNKALNQEGLNETQFESINSFRLERVENKKDSNLSKIDKQSEKQNKNEKRTIFYKDSFVFAS